MENLKFFAGDRWKRFENHGDVNELCRGKVLRNKAFWEQDLNPYSWSQGCCGRISG